MKIFGQEVQFGTVLEVVGVIITLLHFGKTSKDNENIEKELDELEKNSKFGPYIKMARPFVKINKKDWDDEVLYAIGLNELNPEERFNWFKMLYNIAINEPELFDNFVDYLAHLPKEIMINVMKEIIENCDDEESLKRIIIARSAHDPDASGNKQIIKIFREWFVKTGVKKIEAALTTAGEGIKNAADDLSAATSKGNERLEKNLGDSGLLAWSERFLAKSKKQKMEE